eukprot:COSAG05_NODE_2453_length_3046_cov_5.297930_2_plen_97_part_00
MKKNAINKSWTFAMFEAAQDVITPLSRQSPVRPSADDADVVPKESCSAVAAVVLYNIPNPTANPTLDNSAKDVLKPAMFVGIIRVLILTSTSMISS